jgi:hypothetical protein
VHLGVGGHLDVEVVARFGADEGHQVAGVAELAARAVAAGQVAAQRHDAATPMALSVRQLLAHRCRAWHRCTRSASARLHAFGQDLAHGAKVPSCVEPPAP